MIGDGEGRHFQFGGVVDKVTEPIGSVKQGKLGMTMQVNKIFAAHGSLSLWASGVGRQALGLPFSAGVETLTLHLGKDGGIVMVPVEKVKQTDFHTATEFERNEKGRKSDNFTVLGRINRRMNA
jgi:hypothetical protein